MLLSAMLLSAMLLISSTKWCHEWLAAFHIYRHKHFQCITSDVECSFSSQVGLPWFIPPRWRPWGPLACGPTPQVYFWLFVMRVSTRCIIVWKLWLLVFWGLVFETRARCPPATPFVHLGKSAIGSALGLQHRSRVSPCPSSTRLHPQFQAPLPPARLDLGVLSLVLLGQCYLHRQHGAVSAV
jgi:hypothetical protein